MKFKTNPIEGVDLTGKIIVLREGVLKRQYDKFENYFYLATGGFGYSPSAIGRAVFTRSIFDGLDERWIRSDFEGWLTEEEFADLRAKNG